MEALILVFFSNFYQFVNQITGFLIKSFLFGNTPSFWVIVVISSMEFYQFGFLGGNERKCCPKIVIFTRSQRHYLQRRNQSINLHSIPFKKSKTVSENRISNELQNISFPPTSEMADKKFNVIFNA
jgi:hypothetical protein